MTSTFGRLLAAAALAASAGLGSAHAEGNLYFYNWTDYTSPDLLKKFEAETGIKVTLDTYDSNETVLAKLKSGQAGYDLIVISSDFVQIFAEQNLIQKIDGPKLAGYDNIDKRWQSPAWDKGNIYTVPYQWGTTAYSVNTKQVKAPTDSLKLLFDPPKELRGKVGMFGSPSEVISLAEVYLGLPPCQTDTANMKKVSALLEKQAPFVKIYNSDGIIERMASGETWIHENWNGASVKSRLLNADVHYVFPKEGAVGWMDNIAIPASAKNPENAKKFLEFLLKPENMALLSNFTGYDNAIPASRAFLNDDLKNAPELKLPADLKIAFTPKCSEDAIKLMDRVWTKLKK